MYDGSDYYLFEELFLRMIGICFIHCHTEQADECLYHLSRCTEDFFLLRQESENLMKYCKKNILAENQVMENIWQPNWTHRLTSNPSSNKDEKDLGYIYKDNFSTEKSKGERDWSV